MKYLWICLLSAWTLQAQQVRFTTEHLNEVLKYADKDTLVFLDLDNTLIRPKQTLGSDEWYRYSLAKHQQEGDSPEIAREKVTEYWMEIQMRSEMQLLTEHTAEVLQDLLRKKTFAVVGLTKRPPKLAERTLSQLRSLGISFASASSFKNRYFFGNQLLEGIIFIDHTTNKEKGEAVKEFLLSTQAKPKKILLVDDRENHIDSVAAALEKTPIDFIGLHYTKANETIARFNAEIADLQLKKFLTLLSDEDALRLLKD